MMLELKIDDLGLGLSRPNTLKPVEDTGEFEREVTINTTPVNPCHQSSAEVEGTMAAWKFERIVDSGF